MEAGRPADWLCIVNVVAGISCPPPLGRPSLPLPPLSRRELGWVNEDRATGCSSPTRRFSEVVAGLLDFLNVFGQGLCDVSEGSCSSCSLVMRRGHDMMLTG